MMWFWEYSKFFSLSERIAPTLSRLRPAKSQQRPLCFWLVTVQSSRAFDIDGSMDVTISRSSAMSSSLFWVRAFCSRRVVGSLANSLRRSSRSEASSWPVMTMISSAAFRRGLHGLVGRSRLVMRQKAWHDVTPVPERAHGRSTAPAGSEARL